MMEDGIIRRNARLLVWLVSVPLGLLLLLAVVLAGNVVWQGGGRFVPFMLIYYTPMAFYVAAILMVRTALVRIAAGDLFASVLPRLMSWSGGALLVGALFKEVGVPLLTYLFLGRAYVTTFEPSAVTLGIVGALLLVIGQVFGRAVTADAELRQFV